LDRKSLGAIVFGSSDETVRARRRLEAITHPAIGWNILGQALWHGVVRGEMVVLDAALLLRSPQLLHMCSPVVVVDVPKDEQLERLVVRDGTSRSACEARLAS